MLAGTAAVPSSRRAAGKTASLPLGRTAASLDALDAVLHIGVQLPQAVDHVVGRLPVAAPVGLQESGDLFDVEPQVSVVAAMCCMWRVQRPAC